MNSLRAKGDRFLKIVCLHRKCSQGWNPTSLESDHQTKNLRHLISEQESRLGHDRTALFCVYSLRLCSQ